MSHNLIHHRQIPMIRMIHNPEQLETHLTKKNPKSQVYKKMLHVKNLKLEMKVLFV